jgi:hypothetical protein
MEILKKFPSSLLESRVFSKKENGVWGKRKNLFLQEI